MCCTWLYGSSSAMHESRPLAVETNTQGLAFSQPSPPIDNLGDNDDDIHEDNNVDDD